VAPPGRTIEEERANVLGRLGDRSAHAYVSLLERCAHLDPEARRMLAVRIGELIDYQNAGYAGEYVDFVLEVAAREAAVAPHRIEITHAVIRNLYQLMAYKDEYEVARLHLKPGLPAQVRSLFAAPRRLVYHFHPPLLRAMGLRRKLALGPWFRPVLRLLRALRGVRGTRWDVFGYAAVRREERRLIPWYTVLVAAVLDHLQPATYPVVLEIARLPEGIRGYEEIKLGNVRLAKGRAETLMARLREARAAAGRRG
jgi:indolepyruvate ferredoxin oxidoreductase